MHITPVDQFNDLFHVSGVLSQSLVKEVLHTPWVDLLYTTQPGQETWARRKIINQQLPWIDQWNQEISSQWSFLERNLGIQLTPYYETTFWLDEPGFVCPVHTDGELPGSMQLTWIGYPRCGTTFYHCKNAQSVRRQFDLQSNEGYVMINQPDHSGYRHLQWHGMLEPVPENSYRITSYTLLVPVK